MNKYLFIAAFSFLFLACNQSQETSVSEQNDSGATFQNPILAGFNPDPSICRVGDDYYLVNSSFGYFPGIPVLHSKDLVNWEQIGAVLDENQQLNLSEQRITRGFFAPAITHHDGWFYGLYATSNGNPSSNQATFNYFQLKSEE